MGQLEKGTWGIEVAPGACPRDNAVYPYRVSSRQFFIPAEEFHFPPEFPPQSVLGGGCVDFPFPAPPVPRIPVTVPSAPMPISLCSVPPAHGFLGVVCQPGLFPVKTEANLGYSNETSNDLSFDTKTGTKANDELGSKKSLSIFRNQTNDDSKNDTQKQGEDTPGIQAQNQVR